MRMMQPDNSTKSYELPEGIHTTSFAVPTIPAKIFFRTSDEVYVAVP